MFKLCIKIFNSIFLVNKTFLVIEYNCVKSLVKPVKGIMGVWYFFLLKITLDFIWKLGEWSTS